MIKVLVIGKDQSLNMYKSINSHGISLLCSNKYAFWVNQHLVSNLKKPLFFGLLGFKNEPISLAYENETNLLNPINKSKQHYLLDDKAHDQANILEDKIANFVMQDTEKKGTKTNKTEIYLGSVLIILSIVILFLGVSAGIPYLKANL